MLDPMRGICARNVIVVGPDNVAECGTGGYQPVIALLAPMSFARPQCYCKLLPRGAAPRRGFVPLRPVAPPY